MSMFATGFYEVRRLLRDRALPALLILLLVLSAYAAWNGADWLRQRDATINLVKATELEELATMRAEFGAYPALTPYHYAVLPPGAMASLSIGQAEAYPFVADTSVFRDAQIFRRTSADIGSPTVRAAGRFDLAFVIVFLLPLIIVAATYDLWSRERERGVAAIVLAQPVAIGPLIAAKALARGVALVLPSTAIILVAAAFAGARDPGGLVTLALAVLVYGGFWLAVAVIISLFARRSTEAAIGAGAVWLIVVVMAPSLTLAAADLAAPPPSEMQFATALKQRDMQIAERQRLYREANPTPVRAPAPRIPDRWRERFADRVAADRELAPMIEAHERAKYKRRRLLDTVRFVLPSVAMQDALDRIAGSDADRALAFQRQAHTFRADQRRGTEERMRRDAPLTLAEFDRLRGFEFRESRGLFNAAMLADLMAIVIGTFIVLLAAWIRRGRAATP